MSEEAIISTYEETDHLHNAIKYCPSCEQPQHCNHAITYAKTSIGQILPDAFTECSMCECMDCTGDEYEDQ